VTAAPAGATATFDLDAGALCLDFANTLGLFSSDKLRSPGHLLAFAVQAGLVPATHRARLHAELDTRPERAQAAFERARALRRAIYSLFSAVAAGRPPDPADLAPLNRELPEALAHQRLVAGPDGALAWGWRGGPETLAEVLFPIVRSAADLLTSAEQRAAVRQCGASDCAWLFLDTSRNRSRQWCSMQTCGNREKARRYYARRRRPAGSPAPAATEPSR
jgi:predicted RNA-binding Zn ribbon-like protein